MEDVLSIVKKHIDPGRIIELLSDMVEIPSFNSPENEIKMAKYIGDTMTKAGCDVEFQEVDSERYNVFARLKGKGGGKSLILNTHMDVVPPGDGWSSDPFKLSRKDDNLYGRGVMDAKGPLAAMMAAIEAIADSNLEIRGDIVLIVVVDEEVASLGARNLPRDLQGDFAIIGEATNGNLAIAHRGSLRPVLVSEGISAHSSTPNLGRNAINIMCKALIRLEEYSNQYLQKEHYLAGSPTLSATIIQGGNKESMVPDRCEAIIDRRLIPGEKKDEVLKEIENVITNSFDEANYVAIDRVIPTTGGPSEIMPDSPIVKITRSIIQKVYNKKPELVGLTANCDMSHFIKRGIPSVIYGPGDFKFAHKADEHVSITELMNSTLVYALSALKVSNSPVTLK